MARPKSLLSLALAAAVAALSAGGVGAAQAGDCVLAELPSLPDLLQTPSDGEVAGFRLLHLADIGQDRIEAECRGADLAELRIQLLPGERRVIRLLAEAGMQVPLDLRIDGRQEPSSGDWHWAQQALVVDAQGAFSPRQFSADETPLSQLIEIEIGADASNRPGQLQQLRVADPRGAGPAVLLLIETVQEEPLFRDQFRPDPTLGQFSQRTPLPISPGRLTASVSGPSDA